MTFFTWRTLVSLVAIVTPFLGQRRSPRVGRLAVGLSLPKGYMAPPTSANIGNLPADIPAVVGAPVAISRSLSAAQ